MASALTAPGRSTWDGNPNASNPAAPYRPGAADFNGLSLVDDPVEAVTDPSMPSSALLNTGDALEIVYGRMVANAIVSVKFVAGQPVLDSQASAPSATNASPSTNFGILRTPGGGAAGDTCITWSTVPTAATPGLPAPLTKPSATLNLVLGTHNYAIGILPIAITTALAPTWLTAHAYALNSFVQPTVANGYFYKATAVVGTGTSAGAEPAWPTTIGATVIDNPGANQITWTCIGGTTGVQVTTVLDSVLTDIAYTAQVM